MQIPTGHKKLIVDLLFEIHWFNFPTGKKFVGKKFRHLQEISSLFTDEVLDSIGDYRKVSFHWRRFTPVWLVSLSIKNNVHVQSIQFHTQHYFIMLNRLLVLCHLHNFVNWNYLSLYLVLRSSYHTLLTFLMMFSVTLLSMLQASDLWQQLRLASEIEPDIRNTVEWGRKWLVDFDGETTQLNSFDLPIHWDAIDVKMDESNSGEKSSSKMLGFPNWIGALTLSLLLKLSTRKLEPWFVLLSFFFLRLLFISINLLYGLSWNTVAMSVLVLLATTWIAGKAAGTHI